MSADRPLAGRHAVITGGGRGIGRAVAAELAALGASVVLLGRSAEALAEAAAELSAEWAGDRTTAQAPRVSSVVASVADAAAVRDAFADIRRRHGDVDILVNNAGVALATNTQQDEDDFLINWDKTVAVNLTAHAHLVRLAVPHFLAAGAGRVVNIASTESIVTSAGMVAYTATKAGVVGLTKSYAVELGRQGITVNCICPGPIRTGMTAGISDADKETYAKRRVPLRRYGDPEEVAQMTLSMCLPAASFLNGAIVPVDGGMSIRHT
jgi:3-oxoacyl-[acyl-carrier protein] reductase